jgi:hypothetical protein
LLEDTGHASVSRLPAERSRCATPPWTARYWLCFFCLVAGVKSVNRTSRNLRYTRCGEEQIAVPGQTRDTRHHPSRCRQPHPPPELCSSRRTCSSTSSSRACAPSTWTPPRTWYVYMANRDALEPLTPLTDRALPRTSDRASASPKSACRQPRRRRILQKSQTPKPTRGLRRRLRRRLKRRASPRNVHTMEAVCTPLAATCPPLATDD